MIKALKASVLAAALSLGGSSVYATGSPNEWASFRGANGDAAVPALPSKMPEKKVVWQVKAKGGGVHGGVGVAEGFVVMADGDEKNDWYRCFDAEKGTQVWEISFPNEREMQYDQHPRAQPLISGGRVFVQSAFGEFYALDLKTGKKLWEKNFDKDFDAGEPPEWGFCSSPLLAGGKLLINPGGKASVAALKPETGEVIWKGQGSGVNYASFFAGKFGGVEQVIGLDGGSLGGWDLATGKRLWKVQTPSSAGYIVPCPIAAGDKVLMAYEGGDAHLYAFTDGGIIDPKAVGEAEEVAPEVSTPVLMKDMILVQYKGLVCLDAKTLEKLWTNEDESAWEGQFHMIVSGNTLLTFNDRGQMTLATISRQGAKVLGTVKLCAPTQAHPSIANGKIYVRDAKELSCYDLGAK